MVQGGSDTGSERGSGQSIISTISNELTDIAHSATNTVTELFSECETADTLSVFVIERINTKIISRSLYVLDVNVMVSILWVSEENHFKISIYF